MVAVMLVASACGRSAPEDAVAELDPSQEPSSAGIQATSASSVVPPAATTSTTTATTQPPAAAEPAGTYVVQAGDTLSVIAEQFGVSTAAISEANGITDINAIQPGQELIIPAPAG
ncbi:MAG: LysM domain-containing protein [Actinomycetota bacterium]